MANQAIQTSFSRAPAIGYAGMVAKESRLLQVNSRVSASRKLASVVITAANSDTYTLTINGVDYTFPADGSATTPEIAAGLVALINAGTEPVLASGSDTPLLVESKIDAPFGADFTDTTVANRRKTGDFSIVEAETNLATPVILVEQGQEIPFGVGVCLDERSSDKQAVRLPRVAADVTGLAFDGVTMADFAKSDYSQKYHRNSMISVLRKGYIFVIVEEAVVKGDQPFVRYAAGTGTQLGAFRKTVDSSTAAALPNSRYETTAALGGLAIVKLDF